MRIKFILEDICSFFLKYINIITFFFYCSFNFFDFEVRSGTVNKKQKRGTIHKTPVKEFHPYFLMRKVRGVPAKTDPNPENPPIIPKELAIILFSISSVAAKPINIAGQKIHTPKKENMIQFRM